MDVILKDVLNQLYNLNMDVKTVKRLNDFFKALNIQLKGSNDSLLQIETSDSAFYVITNLYNSYMAIIHINKFLYLLCDYIESFNDNKELLYDIIELLIDYKVIKLSHNIKLELFKAIFNYGCFNYVPLDKNDFLNSFNYIRDDMTVISSIIDNKTFNSIEKEFNVVLKELYLYEYSISLKDVLL